MDFAHEQTVFFWWREDVRPPIQTSGRHLPKLHEFTWYTPSDDVQTQSQLDIDATDLRCRCMHSDRVPYVWLPKYGAIPPLRPFRLCDSSFKSSGRFKWGGTSLNLQIGEVVEI